MLGCRNIDSLIDVNINLLPDQGELLEDVGRYRRLVRKLNYLMMTRPCSESVFVSTEDYSLRGDNKDFEYLKKASEKGFLYSYHEHIRVASFSDAN